jgi:hypothetical protein
MIVSSIGTTQSADAVGAASKFKQQSADFKALAQALQAGDLGAAQQAFAMLQQDAPWVSRAVSASATGSSAGSGSTTSPLQALSNALQSGDMTGAQQAFAALQAQHGHQGHHHHGPSTPANSATTPAPPTGTPVTNATAAASINTVA